MSCVVDNTITKQAVKLGIVLLVPHCFYTKSIFPIQHFKYLSLYLEVDFILMRAHYCFMFAFSTCHSVTVVPSNFHSSAQALDSQYPTAIHIYFCQFCLFTRVLHGSFVHCQSTALWELHNIGQLTVIQHSRSAVLQNRYYISAIDKEALCDQYCITGTTILTADTSKRKEESQLILQR